MNKSSRRSLSRYAVDQLLAGKSAKELARELVAALAESGKASEYQFLLNDIDWELEHRQVLAAGKVTTAHPLSPKLVAELKSQVKETTGAREVSLEAIIDESVIGGFKVETSGRIWDETIKGQLMQLREHI